MIIIYEMQRKKLSCPTSPVCHFPRRVTLTAVIRPLK